MPWGGKSSLPQDCQSWEEWEEEGRGRGHLGAPAETHSDKFLTKKDVFQSTVLVNREIPYSYFKNSKYLEFCLLDFLSHKHIMLYKHSLLVFQLSPWSPLPLLHQISVLKEVLSPLCLTVGGIFFLENILLQIFRAAQQMVLLLLKLKMFEKKLINKVKCMKQN